MNERCRLIIDIIIDDLADIRDGVYYNSPARIRFLLNSHIDALIGLLPAEQQEAFDRQYLPEHKTWRRRAQRTTRRNPS